MVTHITPALPRISSLVTPANAASHHLIMVVKKKEPLIHRFREEKK